MSGQNLPVLADFHQSTIDTEVARRIRNNPLTLAPGVGSVGVLVLSFAWWGMEVPLLVGGAALLVFIIAGGNLAYDMTKGRLRYVRTLVSERRQWLDGEIDRLVAHLSQEFDERDIDRAARQLKELEQSFADLRAMLDGRFSDQGLSKDRFLGTSQQLRRLTLETLSRVLDLQDAVRSIPVDELRTSLVNEELTVGERTSIEERIGHFESAQDDINNLLGQVEEALTKLSAITVEVAKVGTDEQLFVRYLEKIEALADGMYNFKPEV